MNSASGAGERSTVPVATVLVTRAVDETARTGTHGRNHTDGPTRTEPRGKEPQSEVSFKPLLRECAWAEVPA